LRPVNDRLFAWILGLGPSARYNLTSSGLSEPDLSEMGVNTSYDRFAAEKDEHARLFAEAVAELYHVEPDNVTITIGASEAIFMVYSVFGTGGKAVVPLPNYEPMFSVPRSLGMSVSNSVTKLSTVKRAMYGLTDPNNPTGRSLDRGMVDELIESSKKKGTIVYVNETYKEFTFPDAPSTYFGRDGNVVTCSTMTKFYGLGRLRVGWILADRQKTHQLLKAKWLISGHNSEYSLWIATQVLRRRAAFVKRARKICSENAELVRRFIEATPSVSVRGLGAAPFCLVEYKKGPGSVSLARKLLERTGVLVAPGDFFGAPKAFRLCFTSDKKTLRVGLRRLSDFLNTQPRSR
jgi:aspartate/methionine/tyrosine aminotransferase